MKNIEEINRRKFLYAMTAAGFTVPLLARSLAAESAAPSRKLRHASFGASGMAWADIKMICSADLVELVAIAEVDLDRAEEAKAAFPEARIYQDWRELLEKEADNIDSVNVSTPDHMHGPIAMAAMLRGKHVYCQKPLAHDLYEVRQLTEYAREHSLVTQMGIQIHSQQPYRQAVSLVQSGTIGLIKEVHLWSNKKWGAEGAPPMAKEETPDEFDWDLWLGVCADRKYLGNEYYHPGEWRRRLDFGTGTFGDMGCHIFDPVFEALALTAPISVRSDGPAPDGWNWATNAKIEYLFPGTAHTAHETIKFHWYDGDNLPPAEILALVKEAIVPDFVPTEAQPRPSKKLMAKLRRQRKLGLALPPQGSIFVGTEGVMLLPHFSEPVLFPVEKFGDFEVPEIKSGNHWIEWVEACMGKGTTSTPFDYSGPLTETVLLGSVAVRFPHTTLKWNAKELRFDNMAQANAHIRRAYRPGWEVAGL
jgi:predicted dehydrogenase